MPGIKDCDPPEQARIRQAAPECCRAAARSRPSVLHNICFAAALTLGLMLCGGPTALGASPLSWSTPQPVVAPGIVDLTRMACAPSSTLCVGADLFNGDIAATANATGGASEWAVGNIDGRAVAENGQSESEITAIACPSTTLCVAVDSSGHILYSTKPAEPASWQKVTPTAGEGGRLGYVACPSASLCLVTDSAGTVLTSTDPSGGAAAWTATNLAVTPNLVGCESPTLCIAVSPAGEVVSSTEPTGGAGKWSPASEKVDPGQNPVRIACTTAFCALADENGNLVTATNPAGAASEWSVAAVTGEFINALSCPSTSLCLAQVGGANAGIDYATNPTGGAGGWKRYTPPHGELSSVTTVACASASLCVGGLFNGILTTTSPTTETTTWASASLPEQTGLSHVSCSSSTLCAAIETNTGNIYTSTDPSKADPTWTSAQVDKTAALTGLSCVPTASLCVAIDGSGDVFTSTEPAGGASKWTKTTIAGAGYLAGVSCPTTTFCTIADQQGHVIASTTPTTGSWSVSAPLSGSPALASVSCPSSGFCAATELSGAKVFTSTRPSGGAGEWKATELEGGSGFNTLACASSSLCVAGDNTDAYATTEPTGGTSKWVKEALGWVTGAACPSESLCVASTYFGELLTAASPTEGVGGWSGSHVDFYERGLNSVSCPTTTFCAAVDGNGDVITGSATAPANTTPPTIKGEPAVGQTLTEEHGSWSNGPILGWEYEWQRCNGPSSCTKIPSAEAQTLVVTAEDVGFELRVLERARNSEGTSAPAASALTSLIAPPEENHEEPKSGGAGATATTAQVATPGGSTPVPVPVVGQRQTVAPVSGTVLVRLKGSTGFVALSAASSIADGSEVEATNGRVIVTVATPTGTESAEVYGGRFVVEQEHTGSDETRLVLSLPLTGCPRVALPRGAAASAASSKHGPKSRHLWVSESGGSWGTNGRYVSTTVEGTHWLTQDECNQSKVQVVAGKVKVQDLVTHKTKTLSAGQHYTAKRN
jgi:hypothetical protein